MLSAEVAPYWDAERNKKSSAEAFSKSTQPAFWKCPTCKYAWTQRIALLEKRHQKQVLTGKLASVCDSCNGKAVVMGVSDLGTLVPGLQELWSDENDQPLSAFTRGSSHVAKWCCASGHSWSRKVKEQVLQPYCKQCQPKKKPRTFTNGELISDVAPALHAELNHEKNLTELSLDTTLLQMRGAGDLLLNWRCKAADHPYKMTVSNRYHLGRGCPKCAGREAIAGETDLATTHPQIVETYWAWDANDILPSEVTSASGKPRVWRCPLGHPNWQAKPASLTLDGQFCPACSGKRLVPNENDLATKCPLAKQWWDYEANGGVVPEQVMGSVRKEYAWRCPKCGYRFREMVFTVARALNSTGRYCAACSGRVVIAGQTDFESQNQALMSEWDWDTNDKLPSEVGAASSYNAGWKCAKGHKWRTDVWHRTHPTAPTGCPDCALGQTTSKGEQAIADWLAELGVEVEQHNRTVLGSKAEIDIWLPKHKLGIEFNGVYWHSEAAGKGKENHLYKWEAAKAAGIQLIQIWEDEWLNRRQIVLALLRHKLGISEAQRVFARKTSVVELGTAAAKDFLNMNHIQGFVAATHYLGLQDAAGALVALLALRKEAGGATLQITRYATSAHVVGGFTKLLSYAEQAYQPERFVTFSDHCVSDGSLYAATGFVTDKVLAPDYRYLVGNQRKHKFGYRIDRFKTDPNLLWEEGKSERELAALNGLHRIWDAGKTRWVKETKAPHTWLEAQL